MTIMDTGTIHTGTTAIISTWLLHSDMAWAMVTLFGEIHMLIEILDI